MKQLSAAAQSVQIYLDYIGLNQQARSAGYQDADMIYYFAEKFEGNGAKYPIKQIEAAVIELIEYERQ